MSELANYSIETDQTVLLSFKDGRKLRVAMAQLANYLGPDDLVKITRALELRRDFIKRHMPKAVLVLAAGGLLALGAVSGPRVVAWLTHNHVLQTAPEPEEPAVVRSVADPSPDIASGAGQSLATDPAAASAIAAHRSGLATKRPTRLARTKPARNSAVATAPTLNTLAVGLPLPPAQPATPPPPPSPAPSTSPSPAPSTTPAPTSSPAPPPSGQVLGDATGPLQSSP